MFENKLVAVMNEKIETGVIVNALAHASLAMGAEIGKESIELADYTDADGLVHVSSKMPYIILKANSNKIRELKKAALQAGIRHIDFVHTMTGGTYVEQLEKTKQTNDSELIFYGIVLFGAWDQVSELTRKFSLWK
jgi:hypothetical protein